MAKRILWAPLRAVCLAGTANAQFNGSIEGTVTDSSQAGVPDAQVVLVQEDTQFTQRTISSVNGFFRITQLPPGKYRLEVSHSGFKTWVQMNLMLAGGEARAVQPRLAVGAEASRIEVTAASSPVETSTTKVARS